MESTSIYNFHPATFLSEDIELKSLDLVEVVVQNPKSIYVTFDQARIALFQYIEGWYNRKIIHESINYLKPEECEQLARQAA